MTLKEDYEKINKCLKYSESLENIINEHHSPLIKVGIGYDHTQCDEKNLYSVVQSKVESNQSSIRKSPRSRSKSVPRNKLCFYGYYFSCNSFGHKVTDCRSSIHNITRK